MAIPQPQAPNCLDCCHIPHTTPSNHHLFILFVCLEGDADKDLMRGAPLSQTQLQSLIFKRWSKECHLHRNLPEILEIPRRLLGQGLQNSVPTGPATLQTLLLQCDPAAPAQCPRGPENSLSSNCSQTPQVQAHQPGDPLHGCILGGRLFG